MNCFRFAIIGAGDIAGFYLEHFHARTDKEGIELAAVCDLLPDRARKLAERFGGEASTDLDALLARADIDACIILTMPPAHAPLAKKCLLAGKHVLTEKPMAMKLGDAAEIVELAQRGGRVLAVSPFILLGASQQRAKSILREGTIGRPVLVTAEMYHGRIERYNPDAERFYRLSGGPLLDVGPYPLSLLVDWFGPVRNVRGDARTLLPDRRDLAGRPFRLEAPDYCLAMLEFDGGVTARLEVCGVNGRTSRGGIEVQGTEGSLLLRSVFDFNGEVCLSQGDEGPWTVVCGDASVKPASGVDWSTGIVELARAARDGRPAANSAALGLEVLRTLLAIADVTTSAS